VAHLGENTNKQKTKTKKIFNLKNEIKEKIFNLKVYNKQPTLVIIIYEQLFA
jgi:hypothetical protein